MTRRSFQKLYEGTKASKDLLEEVKLLVGSDEFGNWEFLQFQNLLLLFTQFVAERLNHVQALELVT